MGGKGSEVAAEDLRRGEPPATAIFYTPCDTAIFTWIYLAFIDSFLRHTLTHTHIYIFVWKVTHQRGVEYDLM